MTVLTPYLRPNEPSGQSPRHGSSAFEAIQTELEAMRLVAQALASVPDEQVRARVMAWAHQVFPTAESQAASTRAEPARAAPRLVDARDSSQPAEAFPWEGGTEKSAPEQMERPGGDISAAAAAEHVATLPVDDTEALSVTDVERLFDDSRPPYGQFPPRLYRPRHLRPRLVLRFRLWK